MPAACASRNGKLRVEEAGGRLVPGQGSAQVGDPKERLVLVGKRRDVALAVAWHGLSERRAQELLAVDRSSYRYEPKPQQEQRHWEALVVPAKQKPHYAASGWACWWSAGAGP